MQKWWNLPGPRRFANRIADDLRQNQNVFLRVPKGRLRNLRRSVRDRLKEDFWQWQSFADAFEDPLRLQDKLGLRSCLDYSQLAGTMLEETDELNGHILWLNISSVGKPHEWVEFLETYVEHSRHTATSEPLLVLSIDGDGSARDHRTPPGNYVNLSKRIWENADFSTSDARLLASSAVREKSMLPIKFDLMTEVIARIALWDQRLAGQLAGLDLVELLEPFEFLRRFGNQEGWSRETADSWKNGTGGCVFGEYQVHSALCAVRGMKREIEQRVWSAEVAVLFPYLEARRQDLIEGLSDRLRDHAQVKRGRQTMPVEKSDYEISEIYRQIRGQKDLSDELLNAVSRLKELRNDIAHHDTIKLKHVHMTLRGEEIRAMLPS